MTTLEDVRVIPVVTVSDLANARLLADALAAGGLPVLEITLRTPQALAAVARLRAERPDLLIGVGTVLSAADVDLAVAAGAQFLVSPGTTESLLTAMLQSGLPLLPGAATAGEAMRLLDRGVQQAKFFPAESSGGPAALGALGGPLPGLRFCATGGITAANASSYLALPNVGWVGGSWMVPGAAVAAHDWATVTRLAAEATRL